MRHEHGVARGDLAHRGLHPRREHLLRGRRNHLVVGADEVPPLTLLQEARIDKSKQLLNGTRWPIVRIVEAVGYSDVVSFARLFSRQVGESPTKFRLRRSGSSAPAVSAR